MNNWDKPLSSWDKPAIEKDVPLPPARNQKYPWRELQIGESFLVTGRSSNYISILASKTGGVLNRKFTTRTQPDGSVRIWRIK